MFQTMVEATKAAAELPEEDYAYWSAFRQFKVFSLLRDVSHTLQTRMQGSGARLLKLTQSLINYGAGTPPKFVVCVPHSCRAGDMKNVPALQSLKDAEVSARIRSAVSQAVTRKWQTLSKQLWTYSTVCWSAWYARNCREVLGF
jgi:hypothetical protein